MSRFGIAVNITAKRGKTGTSSASVAPDRVYFSGVQLIKQIYGTLLSNECRKGKVLF